MISHHRAFIARRRPRRPGDHPDHLTLTGATRRYDVVLSAEMIEAVGERYWPNYLAAIDLLSPGGRAGLQAITMPRSPTSGAATPACA